MKIRRFNYPKLVAFIILMVFPFINISFYTLNNTIENNNSLEEWYYIILLNNSKIGYQHLINDTIKGRTGILKVTEMYTEIKLKRMGKPVKVSEKTIYYETEALQPVRFEFIQTESQQIFTIKGEISGNKINITKTLGKKKSITKIRLRKNVIFPSAIGKNISNKKLKIGKIYQFETFLPRLEKVVMTTLIVQGKEEIIFGNQRINTYKLKITYTYNNNSLNYYAWVDKKGLLYKSFSPLTDLTTVLVPRKEALKNIELVEILRSSVITSKGKIEEPDRIKKLYIRLNFKQRFTLNLISNQRQKIKKIGKKFISLEINQAKFKPKESVQRPILHKSLSKYLQKTLYVQSNDPEIISTANQIAGKIKNAWETAIYLNQWVSQNIQANQSFLFASAREVLDMGMGDCTEHAVLLCAFTRSLGIPSKICFGIVYAKGGFWYHSWVEVFVGNWVAMDPTLNQCNIDATHIKFTESDLTANSLELAEIKMAVLRKNLKNVEILSYE